eukprot:205879_1
MSLLFVCIINSVAGQASNFNCDSSNLCKSETYTCSPNANCYISCIGGTVCQASTFNCPPNYDCYVTAAGPGDDAMERAIVNGGDNGNIIFESGGNAGYSAWDTEIYCPLNGFCNLTATTGGSSPYWGTKVHAEDATQLNIYTNVPWGVGNTYIYCPLSSSLPNNCNVYVENGNYMLGISEIFVPRSYIDISITCKYLSNPISDCYKSGDEPTMHCGSAPGYSSTCEMQLISGYDGWECMTTSGICDDFTYSPTNSPTANPTPTPTSVPTPAPTSNPSPAPTTIPTIPPTSSTHVPTNNPTHAPTNNPTPAPTINPTPAPTSTPNSEPTRNPTLYPTYAPTNNPTKSPTKTPTKIPTHLPTQIPSAYMYPSIDPTTNPAMSIFSTSKVIDIKASTTASNKEESIIYVNTENDSIVFRIVVIFSCVVVGLCCIIISLFVWIKKSKGNNTGTVDIEMKSYTHSENIGAGIERVTSLSYMTPDASGNEYGYNNEMKKQASTDIYGKIIRDVSMSPLPPKVPPIIVTDYGDVNIKGMTEGEEEGNVENKAIKHIITAGNDIENEIVNQINKTNIGNEHVTPFDAIDDNLTSGNTKGNTYIDTQIWFAYVNTYGKQPQNASQLLAFSKSGSQYKSLTFKEARMIYTQMK